MKIEIQCYLLYVQIIKIILKTHYMKPHYLFMSAFLILTLLSCEKTIGVNAEVKELNSRNATSRGKVVNPPLTNEQLYQMGFDLGCQLATAAGSPGTCYDPQTQQACSFWSVYQNTINMTTLSPYYKEGVSQGWLQCTDRGTTAECQSRTFTRVDGSQFTLNCIFQ